jgi:hypothetical protein
MKRSNTQKRTTSLGARLLSLLLAACMVAGLGWTAAGTAYAGDEVTNTVSLTEGTDNQQDTQTDSEDTDENKDPTELENQDASKQVNTEDDTDVLPSDTEVSGGGTQL